MIDWKALAKEIPRTEVEVTHKFCDGCKSLKTIDHFYYLKKQGIYRNKCRACWNDYQNSEQCSEMRRKWREKNPEKVKQYTHSYYEQNREVVLQRTGEYQKVNREQTRAYGKAFRLRNLEIVRLRGRIESHNWRLLNRHKTLFYARTRIERFRHLLGSYTIADIDTLYIEQLGKCVYCDVKFEGNNFTIDHIIPVARHGCTNFPSNLQLLCRSCNSSKNNKTHEEYLLYLSKAFPSRHAKFLP